MDDRTRCGWAPLDNPLLVEYHDREWGVPLHDEGRMFELLVLEGFQAGLSWGTILKKRINFRKSFDGFDRQKMARYDGTRKNNLESDAGIIRNESKIRAAVKNAKSFLNIEQEFGSFD